MKFYAVKAGRQVGIFSDSDQAIVHYPGARYKVFDTYTEARAYFYAEEEKETIDIYTLGCCRDEVGSYAIVVCQNGQHRCYSGPIPLPFCKEEQAHLYAVIVALRLIDVDTCKIYLHPSVDIESEKVQNAKGSRAISFLPIEHSVFLQLCEQLAEEELKHQLN